MKLLILLITTLALTVGCQSDNDSKAVAAKGTLFSLNVESNLNDKNSHLGLWESNIVQSKLNSDFEFQFRFKFENNTLIMANKCLSKSEGVFAVVEISVAYKIENGKLLYLEAVSNEVTENNIVCSIKSDITDLAFAPDFSVSDGLATFSTLGETIVIRKIGN